MVISNLQITDIPKTSAKVTWTSNLDTTSFVEFGTEGSYEFNASVDGFTKDHTVLLTEGNLLPGTTYQLRVRSADAKGNETVSEVTSFLTPGFSVTIKVLDMKSVPVEGANVSLYSETKEAVTDANGEAVFDNVALGEHGLIVRYQGKTKIDKITVAESDTPQTFEQKFAESTSAPQNWIIYGSNAFGAIILLVLALVVAMKLKKRKDNNPSGPATVINQM